MPCPEKDAIEQSVEAYRWCNEPINDSNNFLPNIKENEVKGRPKRALKGDYMKCGNCAVSFFESLEKAIKKFNGFDDHIRNLLGYTHISKGMLMEYDGLITPNHEGHFMLFEYEIENVEMLLHNRFQIVYEF